MSLWKPLRLEELKLILRKILCFKEVSSFVIVDLSVLLCVILLSRATTFEVYPEIRAYASINNYYKLSSIFWLSATEGQGSG